MAERVRDLAPLRLPDGAHLLEERIGQDVAHQHHLAGGEGVLDLGIAAEIHGEVVQHRVLVRRHYRSVIVVRARDDDRAAGDAEALRHPAHEDLIDLLRLERGRDLLHDVHHLGAGARLGPGLVELAAHPEMRLHPRQQLPHPERLGDEVRGPEAEGSDRRLLGRHGGDHEDRQVLEPGIGLDPLEQLEPVHLRHHDVEQQEVELLRVQVVEEVLAPGHGEHLVAVFLEDPGQGAGERLVVVGDEDLGSEGHSASR